MTPDEQEKLQGTLGALTEALRAWTRAGSAAAAASDAQLAGTWDGLVRATSDLEKRLSAWAAARGADARDGERLLADARAIEAAWSSAWEHLGSNEPAPALPAFVQALRAGTADFARLSEDDRRALLPGLKSALRELATAAGELARAPALSVETSPLVGELRAERDEARRARARAEDEARRLRVELDAARLRAAQQDGGQAARESELARSQTRELVAVRAELQVLRDKLARAAKLAVSHGNWTRAQSQNVERLTRQFEAVREAVEKRARAAAEAAPAPVPMPPAPPPPAPPPPEPPPPPPKPVEVVREIVVPDPKLTGELERARAKIAKLTAELERACAKAE